MAIETAAVRRRNTERARRRERRREELLDVADRVIQRQGTGVSMDEIAAEAGITKPVLYRHFGDKDGLYEALTARYVDELAHELRPSIGTNDPRSRLAATIDAYLSYVEREPERYRFLLRAGEQPRTAPLVADFRRRHMANCTIAADETVRRAGLMARNAFAPARTARRIPHDDPLGRLLGAPPIRCRGLIQLGVTPRNPLYYASERGGGSGGHLPRWQGGESMKRLVLAVVALGAALTVALPGAFVGMVLGGASPLDAAQVQLVVLFMLLGAVCVSAVSTSV